ncbi:MAG TPA: recombinase family protein [Pseudolabrys sp.]|nr:recombinase family protein [Pseudolabrys sp.]
MSSTKRAALYVRVSTDAQTLENQNRELRQVARRRGWDVVEVYNDAGISGAKGETDGLASIPCSRTPAGGSSTSSWLGRLTAWAAR